MTIPTTYAGGAKCKSNPRWNLIVVHELPIAINDMKLVDDLSMGKVDLTFGRYAIII